MNNTISEKLRNNIGKTVTLSYKGRTEKVTLVSCQERVFSAQLNRKGKWGRAEVFYNIPNPDDDFKIIFNET